MRRVRASASATRLVSRLAIDHPLAASFLIKLGWPDTSGPNLLMDFVKRDLGEGIRQGRFTQMPIALALNIVAGSVLGASHSMLEPGCERDFAEQSAAAALRALSADAKSAERIAHSPLKPVEILQKGLLTQTSTAAVAITGATARRAVGHSSLS